MSQEQSNNGLCKEIKAVLQELLTPYGFINADEGFFAMGGWWFTLETDEFIVQASQDRSGDVVGICVGSKTRRKPRAHIRGPWSLQHLRGYIEGGADHYVFDDAQAQLEWLKTHVAQLLDTAFLNSDELNSWAVKASRRMFGQVPK